MFVGVARVLGINAIQHISYEKTVAALGSFGLAVT